MSYDKCNQLARKLRLNGHYSRTHKHKTNTASVTVTGHLVLRTNQLADSQLDIIDSIISYMFVLEDSFPHMT